MPHSQRLPSIRSLKRLADMDGPFPVRCHHIILAAERFWFNSDIINFLRQFPPDQVFRSRYDFMKQCQELTLRLRHEGVAPVSS